MSGPRSEDSTRADFGDEPELSAAEQKLRGRALGDPDDPIRNVYYVAFVAALGGLLYGYDTGVISGTLIQIAQDFGITES